MNQTCLSVNNLDFYYGKAHALKSINVGFNKNEVTALIGPSGSGKSTLLRTINRIYALYPGQKATGAINLENQNILDNKIDINELRKVIGMVFQKPTPFPMSIYDNIAFAVKIHNKKIKKKELDECVKDALIKAALWDEVKDKLNSSGTSLSGGQQQRLCIARTLAIKPEIILLDEPTSALDPISTSKIEDLIDTLKQDYTIIIVTHNLNQARRVSDHTIFMMDGEIIEKNHTQEFFNNPTNDKTKIYINTND